MYILGVESATPVAAVAVAAEDKILSERMVNNRKTHSVNLLPMIKAVLKDSGIELNELSGIAVSSGPGSFTGLRIGMSTAKTLAHVVNLPIVGISTLDALALRFSAGTQLVCPILDARKNEIYAGIYRRGECLRGPMALSVKELAKTIDEYGEDILFLGDGVLTYQEQLVKELGSGVHVAPVSSLLPGGGEIACLGLKRIQAGDYTTPFKLLPCYVRLSEAEVKWMERQGCGVECS